MGVQPGCGSVAVDDNFNFGKNSSDSQQNGCLSRARALYHVPSPANTAPGRRDAIDSGVWTA